MAEDGTIRYFEAVAWVHPDGGGDDYIVDVQLAQDSLADAKREVEKALKKRHSAILDDYTIKEVVDPKWARKKVK